MMEQEKVDKLGQLNRYQIAGLAIITSTVASLMMLFAVRRYLFVHGADTDESETSGTTTTAAPSHPDIPHHFSEDLTVPGFIHTGTEILAEDNREGRSPEGV